MEANALEEQNENFLGELPGWDLSDIYESEAQIESDSARLIALTESFVSNYKGELTDPDADTLAASIRDYEELTNTSRKIAYYRMLNYKVDLQDVQKAKNYQAMEELISDVESKIIFFSLEINDIPDEKMNALFEDERIGKYKIWFDKMRKLKPYQLSEKEEFILNQKSLTSNSAWEHFFENFSSDLKYTIGGKEYSSAKLTKFIFDPNEEVRKETALEFRRVLGENAKVFTIITNTLAKDKAINDKLRGLGQENVMQGRNLANNIEDEVVDRLLESVQENYTLAHRYYKLKAKLLGKEKLNSWDRHAPLPEASQKQYSWEEAKEIVLDAYGEFSPQLREVGQLFFDNNWIDVPVRDGKVDLAFAASLTADLHPYLMLNYQGTTRDVSVLAHELGHGVHYVFSKEQGDILMNVPLTLAETASVFAEQLTFRSLLEKVDD